MGVGVAEGVPGVLGIKLTDCEIDSGEFDASKGERGERGERD